MAKINGVEASKIFGLAFSKINGIEFTSEPVEPPIEIDYVTDGLVIYLDGIIKTTTNNTEPWISVV